MLTSLVPVFIHILYTGCAKIKKNNSGAKGLINAMEQNFFWEINRWSAAQEILYLLRRPAVHDRVNNNILLIPFVSHINHYSASVITKF